MLLIIFLLLIILSFINPKSKYLSLAIIFFMWIIYGMNTYSGDYKSYEYVYNNISVFGFSHYEFLFSFIMVVCGKMGLSFHFFRMVLATIFVMFLYKTVKLYTVYTALALSFIMIFPFPYYVSVLRAGLAAVIIVWSVQFLYYDNIKNNVKFIAGILFASAFHYYALFFLAMLFAKKKLNQLRLLCIMLGTSVIALLFKNIDLVFIFLSHYTDRAKTLQWFTQSSNINLNWKGILIQIGILVINIYLIRKVRMSDLYKFETQSSTRKRELWFCNFVYNANLMLILISPFMFINDTAMRFVWVILILNICMWSNYIYILKQNMGNLYCRIGTRVPIIGIISGIWIIFISYYMSSPGADYSSLNLFFNNLLGQL